MDYGRKVGSESRKTDGGRDYGRKEGMGSRKTDEGRDYGRKEGIWEVEKRTRGEIMERKKVGEMI